LFRFVANDYSREAASLNKRVLKAAPPTFIFDSTRQSGRAVVQLHRERQPRTTASPNSERSLEVPDPTERLQPDSAADLHRPSSSSIFIVDLFR
jgi:hypothetical protein